ncbi:MAG: tetratricopeptide repeat protein, partial [Planctomycetota bacterium]
MGKSKVLISAILLLLWFLTIGCALPPEIEKGDKAFQAGNYDEAIANYQKAVQNYPNEPEYHKKWKEALKKGAQYHFDKGQEYRKKKFLLQKAIEEYTKALDYQPDFIKARKARSEVRAYINLLKWKIKLAKKALELKDWFRAEKLLWLHRKYTPTLPEIQEIWHKAAKESFALYMAEGLRYYSLERYKQALKYFEEAYRLFPEDESCKKKLEITKKKYQSHQLVLQTLEEMKNNNFSKARALSKKALELDPENKQALQFLQEATRNRAKKLLQQGLKFMNQDKLVEAYKSILKAIALKPPGKLLKKDLEDKKKHLQKKIAAKLYLLADKLER